MVPGVRQFIRKAIQEGDKETLSRLRGNTHKPIHIVDGWFYHFLMEDDEPAEEEKVLVFFTPKALSTMSTFFDSCDKEEIPPVGPANV